MADQKVQAPNQLGQLQTLMTLIGGDKQTATTSPTNTAPLEGVLAQMQGVNYDQLLQSIFQQAAGTIPGFQAAYANAVGARSGSNSAMQAALQNLLKQTTVESQKQVATLQQQNLANQANAASNLRGQQTTTAKPSQLGQMAALIGLLQGATKLGGFNTVQDMLGAVTGTAAPAAQAPAPVRDAVQVEVPQTAQMSMAPDMQSFNVNDAFLPAYDPSGTNMSMAPEEMFTPLDLNQFIGNTPAQVDMSMAPAEWFEQPDIMSYF